MSGTSFKTLQIQAEAANDKVRREQKELAAQHEARRLPSGLLEVLFEGGEEEGGLFSGARTREFSPSQKSTEPVCVGHVSLAPGEKTGDLKLAKIHIEPWFRRCGYGRSVMDKVVRLARKRGNRAIVGAMAPEAPEFAASLRRFYERL